MYSWIQKVLSYFYPISIHRTYSEVNGWLDVVLYKNSLMVDTKNTNYSYGSLQKILKFGLEKLNRQKVLNAENILILGVAGGSVIKTLIEDFKVKAKITGVEIDSEAIEIANQFFKINKLENVEIIQKNAEEFIFETLYKYDLIIIDLFVDKDMPDFIFSFNFIKNIKEKLTDDGCLLFNTMLDKTEKDKIDNYLSHFENQHYKYTIYNNVEKYNDLVLIEKI